MEYESRLGGREGGGGLESLRERERERERERGEGINNLHYVFP